MLVRIASFPVSPLALRGETGNEAKCLTLGNEVATCAN